ncbi:MAG: MmgE/PrpD family protein [Halobacteriales archaeon]
MDQDASRTGRAPAETIATRVARLGFDDLSRDVVERVEAAFVDTVGVGLGGAVTGAGRIASAVVTRHSGGPGEASLFDGQGAASITDAGFANGTAAHCLDYDDVSDAIIGHPSACLVPAILAVAEVEGATGAEAVTAYVAGFETAAAIAAPVNPDHYERGWHATSTLGTFGAAAAAASLLDLDPDGTAVALNLAASLPAGLKRNFGSMAKPMHAGAAVRSGLTAALLAADGFGAAPDAIGGPAGFMDLYGGEPTDGADVPEPGTGEAILDPGLDEKKYPCCYFSHTAIEAARDIAGELGDVAAVESVRVTASGGAGDALIHPDPGDPFEARFSMEHVVAHALAHGDVGPPAFEPDRLADPDVAALRDRVTFEVDGDLPYESYASTVSVRTADGSERTERYDRPPGSSQNPLTTAERRAKFEDVASAVLGSAEVDQLYDGLSSLSEAPAVADVLVYR